MHVIKDHRLVFRLGDQEKEREREGERQRETQREFLDDTGEVLAA